MMNVSFIWRHVDFLILNPRKYTGYFFSKSLVELGHHMPPYTSLKTYIGKERSRECVLAVYLVAMNDQSERNLSYTSSFCSHILSPL